MNKKILVIIIALFCFIKLYSKEISTDLLNILPENMDIETIKEIEDPFEADQEMKEWARRIGRQGYDMEKARKLYEGILSEDELNVVYYNNPRLRPMGYKTAKEVFHDKDKSGRRFAVCGEYSYLYIAMAREIGLNVSYVQVEVDRYGKDVNHACVGLFIDGRVVLVDPAYNSFDIKHQKYRFLDDVEAVARHHVDDGLIYSSRGDRKESIKKLSLAVKIAPNFYEAYTWLGDMLYRNKDFAKAYMNYSKSLELRPDFIEAWYKKTQAMERLGKTERAYEEYEKMSRYISDNPEVLFWSAEASYKLRDYNSAIEKLDKVIKINEKYKEAYRELINIYTELGNRKKVDELYKKSKIFRSDSVVDYYQEGLSLYNIERYDEAIAKFKKVISIDNEYKDGYFWMGRSYEFMKNYGNAIRAYKKVIDLDEDYLKAYYYIAKTYEKTEDSNSADIYYKRLKSYDLKHSDGKYWAGMAFYELKDYKTAREKFKEAVWLNGGNLNAQFFLGISDYVLKDYDLAVLRLKKLISLAYDYENAYYYLGASYYQLKDYKQARWIVRKGLGFNRKSYDLNYLMGVVEFHEKDYKESIKYLKRAIDFGGKSWEIYYYLGYAYKRSGKDFEAKKYYSMALEKNSDLKRYLNYTKQ